MDFLKRFFKKCDSLGELLAGIGAYGILCQAVICVFFGRKLFYHSSGLWIGVIMAAAMAFHMTWSLDKALDLPEGDARKKIYFGYLRRYVILGAMLAIFCISDKLDPIVFFIAYITLKLSAYLQPLTHKFFNAYFNETDPVSISQEEYDALHPEIAARFNGSRSADGEDDKSSEASEQIEK